MSITIQTGMKNGQGISYAKQDLSENSVTFAGITVWKPISIKSGNTAPKGGISTKIELFSIYTVSHFSYAPLFQGPHF